MMNAPHRRLLAGLGLALCALAAAPGVQAGKVPYASDFKNAGADLSMSPGEDYPVRALIRNAGARAWLPGEVELVAKWTSGPGSPTGIDDRGFKERVPRSIPFDVAVQMQGKVTGPSMPGDWILTLRMAQGGKPFGDKYDLKIKVLTNYKADLKVSLPSKVQVGRKYTAKVVARNTGQSDWDKDRIVLRSQVLKSKGGALNDFFGAKFVTTKMTKTVLAGESLTFLVPVNAKVSGEYELIFYLWDEDEDDEVTGGEKAKVTVQ